MNPVEPLAAEAEPKKPRGGRDICRPRTHPHATPTKTLGRGSG